MAAPKSEFFWWFLFSAGGMMTAIFLPGHVLFQGILLPMGRIPAAQTSYERMHALLSHPIAKLYLFALISLSLSATAFASSSERGTAVVTSACAMPRTRYGRFSSLRCPR